MTNTDHRLRIDVALTDVEATAYTIPSDEPEGDGTLAWDSTTWVVVRVGTGDPDLPTGLGDEQRLTQVLLNLVGNAIKFTDSGEVLVSAGLTNGSLAVSVADTGPGIPVGEQSRIFEQFHQVDNSNTKAKGGTGLGLAIAKQIVEMHGGRIWVESSPGHGAKFQLELPVRATAAAS